MLFFGKDPLLSKYKQKSGDFKNKNSSLTEGETSYMSTQGRGQVTFSLILKQMYNVCLIATNRLFQVA